VTLKILLFALPPENFALVSASSEIYAGFGIVVVTIKIFV